jgi:mannose-6-phosphate isomerase-like protein (cupin superfamily)
MVFYRSIYRQAGKRRYWRSVHAYRGDGRTAIPPAPHIHHREDETYYILEGEFEFLDQDRTFTAGAGSVVYLPKDRLHSHRNPGDVPAKAMVLYTPAGNIEKFIEEVGKPATDPTSVPPPPEEAEIERLVTIAVEKYGFEVPPPPPE